MNFIKLHHFIVLPVVLALLCNPAGARAQAEGGENIALGRPVTFNPAPTYDLCTDADDSGQLTDGLYADKSVSMWRQKGAVGWAYANPVIITIDLGSVQPIDGVSYSTAAGSSDVAWPTSIFAAVSDDGKTWYRSGNLALLSRRNGVPKATGYQPFRYVTREMETRGRYLSLYVVSLPFVFTDEVEVYRGAAELAQAPREGEPIADLSKFVTQETTIASSAQRRLYDDADAVRAFAASTKLPPGRGKALNVRLENARQALLKRESLPVDFRTVIPIDNNHRDILAVYGELLHERGFPSLTVWKQHRYAWLPLLAQPLTSTKPLLEFAMLKNQFRSDAMLLTNATGAARKVKLRLSAPPRGAAPGWLRVSSVAWTDTAPGQPVADALLPLKPENGVYTVDIPAGMTGKVWFLVDSSRLPAGSFNSSITVDGASRVPLQVAVSRIAMPRPRLSVGTWDYITPEGSSYAVTPHNRKAAKALLDSYYVDTVWTNAATLPWPGADAFDSAGNMLAEPDFGALDRWIAFWPGARRYCVYINAGESFAGAAMNSPEFQLRLASWAGALSKHATALKLKPKQLTLCFLHGSATDWQAAIIAAWGRAVKAGTPEIAVFDTPSWLRPDEAKNQAAIVQADIMCPPLLTYREGGEPAQAYYEKLRSQGRQLWLFRDGGVRLVDPQRYQRGLAWQAFAANATGVSFWAFGDNGGAPTSWSGYSGRVDSAAAFFDIDSVRSSLHWEAMREGIEDYEELALLRDAIAASHDAKLKAEARKVLDAALKTVNAGDYAGLNWSASRDAGIADRELRKVRGMLERLNGDQGGR